VADLDETDLDCIGFLCITNGKDECCNVLRALSQSTVITEVQTGVDVAKQDLLKGILEKYSPPPAAEAPEAPAAPEEPAAPESEEPAAAHPNALPGWQPDAGDQCLCPTGNRGVNVAGLGIYKKSNFQMKGPGGGKCTSEAPCDQCVRAYGSDRFPCCLINADGSAGKCGAEQKKPQFNNQMCKCSGYSIGKERIYEKDSNCMPDTACNKCKWQGSKCA